MMSIELGCLKPGMILAKPVYNAQGQLLANKGRKLSDKDIHNFKAWGIAGVAVKGKTAKRDKDHQELPIADTREFIEGELEEKFFGVLDDPVMVEIMEAAKRQLLRIIQNQEHEHARS